MWRVVAVIVFVVVVITRGYFWIDHTSFADNVDPEGWRDAAVITIDNRDTTNLYNTSLFLLYEPERAEREIALHVVTKSPSGEQRGEQMLISLDPETSIDAMLRRKIQHVQYKYDVKWSEIGEYKIFIYPQRTQQGVVATGIKLDRTTTI